MEFSSSIYVQKTECDLCVSDNFIPSGFAIGPEPFECIAGSHSGDD